jgi:hypothetical protein
MEVACIHSAPSSPLTDAPHDTGGESFMLTRRLRPALAAAILLVLPATAAAQDRQAFPAAMEAFSRRALARTEAVPGMAVAVVDQGGTI